MKQNKGVTIAALVIAIVGLSIGFAAFSNTLTIKTNAAVNPDSSTFQVKFSKVSNADQTGSSYKITPTLTHTGAEYAVGSYDATNFGASDGEIDSSNPLLFKDLQAQFTKPGQTVGYKLYIRNTGSYTAYLTNVNFKNIAGTQTPKSCDGNVTTALKNAACADITITLRIGSTDGVGGDLYQTSNDLISTTQGLSYTSLAPGASVEAYVTINYADNGNYPDGPMTVTFGDIMLQYRSVNSPLAIPDPVAPASPAAGTYLAYMVPSGAPEIQLLLNQDGTGVATIAGETSPFTYSIDEENGLFESSMGDMYFATVGNNKIIYATSGGLMMYTTAGGTDITPLTGFVYEIQNQEGYEQSNETITFGSNGSATRSNDGVSGIYAVIDDALYIKFGGNSYMFDIAQDYSEFSYNDSTFIRQS